MVYQMENEELQIASCSMADLTVKQIRQFTEQWEEDVKLGEITLFYDSNNELLVLNRNNMEYKKFKDIAESYLLSNEEQRKRLRDSAQKSTQEALQILEMCICDRLAKKEIFRAMKNFTRDKTSKEVVKEIIRDYDPYAIGMIAFRYGIMQGKRAERTKKKARVSV